MEIGLPTLLALGGGAISAVGTIAGGQAAKAAGDYRAQQAEMAAKEARAASQREAMDKRREGTLMASRLQARAAASGGGADDPTVLDLAGDIAQRSEYGALLDMYKGENRARGLLDDAATSRFEGRMKQNQSYLAAAGTLLKSVAGAYDRYNPLNEYGNSPYRGRSYG